MGVTKFVYGGVTKFDISDTTAVAADVASGKKFYGSDGEEVIGTNTYDADTSDATATEAGVLNGSTFYKGGQKHTGSMPNRGAVTGEIDDLTDYTIPAGFHDGSGTVGIDSTEKAKIIAGNIKSGVSILGVTGSYSGEAVSAQAKSVTPTTSQQTVLPDSNYDYLSQVTVAAIPYSETPNPQGGTTITVG